MGSFSHSQDNINYLAIDDNLSINIARFNNNVARVELHDMPRTTQAGWANGAVLR